MKIEDLRDLNISSKIEIITEFVQKSFDETRSKLEEFKEKIKNQPKLVKDGILDLKMHLHYVV